jgi:undecaprenyl-diphosphatase
VIYRVLLGIAIIVLLSTGVLTAEGGTAVASVADVATAGAIR